jgi:CBS domain containing-hemolysin-like protein
MTDPDPGAGDRPASTPSPGDREPRSSSLYGWVRAVLGFGSERSPRQALQELIAEEPEGPEALEPSERAMMANLLRFGELRVDDVMVPRADIVAVEHSATLQEIVKLMIEAGHSRLPVYRDSLDDVVGIVHVRDLLPFWNAGEAFELARVCRRVPFVPPSMRVVDLLLHMRTTRIHMALVVDEYGGTDGLVTIEDLVEQIVGEIQDEHDVESAPMLVDRPGDVIEADARTPIEALELRLGVDLLPDDGEEDVDTLSGLVSSLAGRVPSRGELVVHPSGIEFEVIDADPRRVKRLRIRRAPAAAPIET